MGKFKRAEFITEFGVSPCRGCEFEKYDKKWTRIIIDKDTLDFVDVGVIEKHRETKTWTAEEVSEIPIREDQAIILNPCYKCDDADNYAIKINGGVQADDWTADRRRVHEDCERALKSALGRSGLR